MPLLSDDEVIAALGSLAGWARHGAELRRVFRYGNFVDAMGFVTRVALLAERANHHPDIDIRWNTVTLALSTHSAGGLTEADTDLAAKIDAVAGMAG